MVATFPVLEGVVKSFSNMLILYPFNVIPGGGDQLNVGLALVPDRVILVIKGISPGPASDMTVVFVSVPF